MSEPVKTDEGGGGSAAARKPFSGLGGPLRDEPAEKPEGHPDARWLGNRWWIPNDEWRTLRGILKDSTLDTSEERAKARAWELEHDDRKFGRVPQS